jgi:hypothetical protein
VGSAATSLDRTVETTQSCETGPSAACAPSGTTGDGTTQSHASGTARMNAFSTERRLRNGTALGRVKRLVRYRPRTPGPRAADARFAAISKSSVVRSDADSSDASFRTMSGSPIFPTIRSSPARAAVASFLRPDVTSTSGACRCAGSGGSPPRSGATPGRQGPARLASRPWRRGAPPPTTTCGPRRTARPRPAASAARAADASRPRAGRSAARSRTRIGGLPFRGHERPFGIAAYAPTIAIGTTGIFMSSASRDVPWRNRWSHPSVDRVPSGTR